MCVAREVFVDLFFFFQTGGVVWMCVCCVGAGDGCYIVWAMKSKLVSCVGDIRLVVETWVLSVLFR